VRGSEIRRRYVEFFRGKGHDIVPSASLVPVGDASLLWINSGMAPLKPYFDGRVTPPNPRLTNSQKCIRTNDIELVGKTARHLTFFEMLGNFSIGDYFKAEAISWAWEFVTRELGLEAERLSVTIHPEDDEAFELWHGTIGLDEGRILRLDENFWDIGEGPCGPNSEIFYDRGPHIGCGRPECDASCDCDRFLEIWNLVFSQFNHNPDGSYTPLPKKNIDTGMGLERTAVVLQGVDNNYETDLLRPIVEQAAHVLRVGPERDATQLTALKIVADHVRTVTFAITDGVLPSNEGRGYVIRRLLRRAVRAGNKLGARDAFLYGLVGTVAQIMGDYYPEVLARAEHVAQVIKREEDRFSETLAGGETLLAQVIDRVRRAGEDVIPGAEAFKLYDTYGFPLDLTREIADEHGLRIDDEGYQTELQAQRTRAKSARREVDSMRVQSGELTDFVQDSRFVGYSEHVVEATVVGLFADGRACESAGEGQMVSVVLDSTPFYAESGGQVADTGEIVGAGCELFVRDVQKLPRGQHVHACDVAAGEIRIGDRVTARIDPVRRREVERNHTATHLLHHALREVLGTHVAQAGSLVEPERLRFDFSHQGPLTEEQMRRVEQLVNAEIWRDAAVSTEEMARDEALQLGAMALFGEKYGETVRVVRAGPSSIELCGGCHVQRTGQIGLFMLASEEGIGSGVRRVVALTGRHAYQHVAQQQAVLQDLADALRCAPTQLVERVGVLQAHVRDVERDLDQARARLRAYQVDELLLRKERVGDGALLVAKVQVADADFLRLLAEDVLQRDPRLLVTLCAQTGERLSFVTGVGAELAGKANAGQLVKQVAAAAGGSGGGRGDIAQAGSRDVTQLEAALRTAQALLREALAR